MCAEGRLDRIPGGLRRSLAGCRTRGSVLTSRCLPLVEAAALVPIMVVVTVAAAGLAMLVGVLVVMAVAVAGGLAGLRERAGNEGLDAGVAAALGGAFLLIYLVGVSIYQIYLWIKKWRENRDEKED